MHMAMPHHSPFGAMPHGMPHAPMGFFGFGAGVQQQHGLGGGAAGGNGFQFDPMSAAQQQEANPIQPTLPHTIKYGPPEPALKHEYDGNTGKWRTTEITVALDPTPFQQGTLRHIYHLVDYSLPEGNQEVVAKMSKEASEPSDSYFSDVKMQWKAKLFADEFNKCKPPKAIDFVVPWVVEFKRRQARSGQGRLVMNVEGYLTGTYIKHSNNFGFVSQEDRNTPQAFSHFTFHHSRGQMLVCDIQGVDDMYTDPQIHSAAMRFGKADLGQQGFAKFFSTHKCNAICEFLRLTPLSGMRKTISFRSVMANASSAATTDQLSDHSSERASEQADYSTGSDNASDASKEEARKGVPPQVQAADVPKFTSPIKRSNSRSTSAPPTNHNSSHVYVWPSAAAPAAVPAAAAPAPQ